MPDPGRFYYLNLAHACDEANEFYGRERHDMSEPIDPLISERAIRLKCAAYCEARAAKSKRNADDHPAVRDHWLDVAAGEWSCATMLRSGESFEAMTAALEEQPREARHDQT
jgi:hypothetical protein